MNRTQKTGANHLVSHALLVSTLERKGNANAFLRKEVSFDYRNRKNFKFSILLTTVLK